ncbi:MAG: GDP-mannose 4,6-dehydratase [Micrococcus sp.]|nr:GDP-mannose 4,6-dehydratase [Micrococcus sp.]
MLILVTGVTGQDGSYLAERLLSQGHTVVGTSRSAEEVCDERVQLHALDLAEPAALAELVRDVRLDRIFHLAALSSVGASWNDPVGYLQANAVATTALLEAAWQLHEDGHPVRVVNASSAEIFGDSADVPQNEDTVLAPTNPYGVSKAAAHHSVAMYRARGLHASNLVLYNHESPRRPEQFVTRKITAAAAAIAAGQADELRLGNLDARRDWGAAQDVVEALCLAAAAEEADDYVIGTGVSHSVRDFVTAAFDAAGIGEVDDYVVVDPQFYRPVEAAVQVADPRKAAEQLGWRPVISFKELVADMVRADMAALGLPTTSR